MLSPELTEKDLETIVTKIEDGLEELSCKLYPLELRNHLGMSEIGKPCSRQIFYKFRWMFQPYYNGRMRRLFARGHREEERYVSYLEGIGCKVERFENPILNYHPESGSYFLSEQFNPGDGLVADVTGILHHELEAKRLGLERKQFRVTGVMGHYGGSCDAKITTPWFSNKLLGEFKTHNTNSFSKYVQYGVKKTKPEHWDQQCSYGWKMGLQYSLYFPENKNDDDIQVEVLKLDWNRGEQLERKAAEIILAKEPPPRISDNPAFQECKFCDAIGICHKGEIPLKNCRSCRMSSPVENGNWYCSKWQSIIPSLDYIKKGCDNWMPI